MTDDEHGDVATAAAAAASGVPMVASTLMQGPDGGRRGGARGTRLASSSSTPNDRGWPSLVHRAEAAGYAGIVVTLDTWTLGCRPRDLQPRHVPRSCAVLPANYFSDPVGRAWRPRRGQGRSDPLDHELPAARR